MSTEDQAWITGGELPPYDELVEIGHHIATTEAMLGREWKEFSVPIEDEDELPDMITAAYENAHGLGDAVQVTYDAALLAHIRINRMQVQIGALWLMIFAIAIFGGALFLTR